MPLYEGMGGTGLMNEKINVIFDFGSAYTKAGFAGEFGPRAIIKSEVKCRTTGKVVPVFQYQDKEELRHHLVDFIYKLYFKYLLVNPKDRRVVVVENPLGPSIVRETIASVLFRHYEVVSVLFAPSHTLALMTMGLRTGLVLDLGYQEASLLPVYEGVTLLQAWQALPLASQAIHSSLCEVLLERAVAVTEHGSQQRLSALEEGLPDHILEDIKVRGCFVTSQQRAAGLQSNKYDRSVEPPPPPPSLEYPLAGRLLLTVPGTVREMAAEILFERDLDGLSLPNMVLDALLKCPVDTRQELASNIVIVGGTASLTGLKHRLLSELRSLATSPAYTPHLHLTTFKVHQPPAKDNYVAWLGGALLGATEAVVVRSLPRELYLTSGVLPDWCNLATTDHRLDQQA